MVQLKETMETLKLLATFAHLGSVINSKGDCSQEEKAEAQQGSNRRVRKDHGEQRCVIRDLGRDHPHPLFIITMHRGETWVVKMADKKRINHLKSGVGGELCKER